MFDAITAVRSGMPTATAAKKFNVPRVTLSYKIKGKYPIDCKSGATTILTSEEESRLENWIIDMARLGFSVTKDRLLDSVALLVKKLNRKNTFNNGRPGRHWYEGFLKRHPLVSERMTQNFNKSRSVASENTIRKWFTKVDGYFKSEEIDFKDDPRRIFNCDETVFSLCPKGKKVVTKKSSKAASSYGNGDEKECITTLILGNAAGELVPPMVLYSNERRPKDIICQIPTEWAVGKLENGRMTGESFYEYITDIFHPWLVKNSISLPVVLYVDGQKAHFLTMSLSEFCSRNQIILISLIPNSTHVLQPMNVGIFDPLQDNWKKVVQKWKLANDGESVKDTNFGPLLGKAINNTLKNPNVLEDAFRTCGLFPFNPDDVNYTKLASPNKQNMLNSNNNAEEKEKIRANLKFIESYMKKNKLNEFYRCKATNTTPKNIEDKSLYKLWCKIFNDCEVEKEPTEDFNISDPLYLENNELVLEEDDIMDTHSIINMNNVPKIESMTDDEISTIQNFNDYEVNNCIDKDSDNAVTNLATTNGNNDLSGDESPVPTSKKRKKL